jgi:hypothetical protein
MNLAKEGKLIEAALDAYRARLDTIPDALFGKTPPSGGWSYAEVYSHIFKANVGCIRAINSCASKACAVASKGLNLAGLFTLGFSRFPPFAAKQPQQMADRAPAEKITKEEARNQLVKLRKLLENIKPAVHQSNRRCRQPHPRLGMLNAGQWLKFIRIHSQHHLKQLDRITRELAA